MFERAKTLIEFEKVSKLSKTCDKQETNKSWILLFYLNDIDDLNCKHKFLSIYYIEAILMLPICIISQHILWGKAGY